MLDFIVIGKPQYLGFLSFLFVFAVSFPCVGEAGMDGGQRTALEGLFPPSLQTQAAHIKGSREPLFLYPLFRKHRYNGKEFEAVIKKTHVFEPTIKLVP